MANYSAGPDSSKINPAGFPGLLFVILVVAGMLYLFPSGDGLIALGVIVATSAVGAVLLYWYRSRGSE